MPQRSIENLIKPTLAIAILLGVCLASADLAREAAEPEMSLSPRSLQRVSFQIDASHPAPSDTGQAIYAEHCAACHGANGEGNADQFADSLTGDLTVDELTNYIAETMPEENPEAVVGDDAKQVAKFIFDQFYSPAAQARINKPRVELARLTVEQYRNRVADLIASFLGTIQIKKENGLKARYFASRGATKSRQLSSQRDPNIDFPDAVPHFDPTGKYKSVPKPKKKTNNMNDGFSAYWSGVLTPPETGNYTIKVKSKNGFELFVNDPATPLIDRNVRSDEVVDHTANLYLLAGRSYHFKLNFFSYPNPPAKLQLLWQPPSGPEVVIPPSAFSPGRAAEQLAVSTSFPADDASAGFERGVDISAEWDGATTRAAIEVAEWISDRIERLANFKIGDEDSDEKVKSFCYAFVARAFVTKLSDEDRNFYVDRHFEASISLTDKIKRVVILTLKSPRFLFPDLERRTQNFAYANAMAMTLWDSSPDKSLFNDAERGQLESKDTRLKKLNDMLNRPQTRNKLNSFFDGWLTAHAEDLEKDKDKFPQFDANLLADLKTSLRMQVNDVVWDGASDYRQLFLANHLYLNQSLAKFYELDWPTDDDRESKLDFQKVASSDQPRQGVITHPYLMAGLAYHAESSPIHRGVFVAKRLLGVRLRQPPDDIKPLTEEFAPEMTNRQRVEHQTKEPTCMSCHRIINPLGFAMENLDAVGRFRDSYNGKPINVTSEFITPAGETLKLNGAEDLAKFLADSPQAQKNFIRQLFRFYTKNEINAYGPNQLNELHQRFVAKQFSIRELLVDITMVAVDHTSEKATSTDQTSVSKK